MKCPKCNSDIQDKMCIRCGYMIENDLYKLNQTEISNNWRKALHKFLFLIIFIVIIISFFTYKQIKNYITISHIIPVNELTVDRTSIHYVNDLYISDGYFYNYLLNKNEKIIYDKILNSIKNFDKRLYVDISDFKFDNKLKIVQMIKKVISSITMDHPELIQYGIITYTYTYDSVDINIRYALDEDEYHTALYEIRDVISKIRIETTNMNDYEKIKYVYEYLAISNSYGDKDSYIGQSAYSAIDNRFSPVCAGYARAAQILLRNIGIDSLLITGSLDNVAHEWNVVKIENDYYHFDVTTSSSYKAILDDVIYSGFLFKDTSDYNIYYNKVIPKIDGKKYDYFKINGLYFKYNTHDIEIIKTLLNENGYVEFKMKDRSKFINNFTNLKKELNADYMSYINDVMIIKKY